MRLDSVTVEVATRELSVVVPARTLKDPLETVTLPADEGLRTMLEVAESWRLLLALMAMEPYRTGTFVYA